MKSPSLRSRSSNKLAVVAAIAWLALVLAASRETPAQTSPADQPAAATTTADTGAAPEEKIPEAELDSLVAPIALYPDPLLAQTLAASTYPIEIMQLQQWLDKNKELKDKALADAVAKQPWDPSVQAMAAFPEVAGRMAGTSNGHRTWGRLSRSARGCDERRAAHAREGRGQRSVKDGRATESRKESVGGEEVIVIE